MHLEAVLNTTYSMNNSHEINISGISMSNAQHEKSFQFKLKTLSYTFRQSRKKTRQCKVLMPFCLSLGPTLI